MVTDLYILIESDGYESTVIGQSYDVNDLQVIMSREYEACKPKIWIEEYKESSFCGDLSATLFNNGDSVSVWNIEKLHLFPPAYTDVWVRLRNGDTKKGERGFFADNGGDFLDHSWWVEGVGVVDDKDIIGWSPCLKESEGV